MVEAALLIPLVILAITQILKKAIPTIQDWLTIIVAIAVGIVIAIFDGPLGISDISIAQGIVFALGAVGVSVAANKAGGKE